MPDPLQPLIISWVRALRAENKSSQTVVTYRASATQMARWLTERTNIRTWDDVRTRHVQEFMQYLLGERGCKASTASNRYRGLQQFYNWLLAEEEISTHPMLTTKPPKIPDEKIPIPDTAKLALLVRNLNAKDFHARRDRAIFSMFINTAIRLTECATIQTADLDLDHREVTVLGKGRRPRTLRFGRRTALALDRYIRIRDTCQDAHLPNLWLGEKQRGPLHSTGIHQMVQRRGREVDLPLHAHQLRHLFAHEWLAAGGGEGDLMQLMGWKSRQMLQRYGAELASERARDAHDRIAGVLDRLI